jgi:hypothetical protein
MKSSAIKTVQSLFNKKNVNKLKNSLNKKTISLAVIILFVLITSSYFIRPIFFDYKLDNKKIIEKKIKNTFKMDAKIIGDISYKFFPSPRLVVNKIDLNFDNKKGKKTKINKSYILLSPFELKNFKNLKLEKFLISNEKIKIHPEEFKNYFVYFTILKKENMILRNCELSFADGRGGIIVFSNVNLDRKFKNDKHQIKLNAIFSNSRIKIKFLNHLKGKKYFKVKIPNTDLSLDIIFNKGSNLKTLSGQLKLNLIKSILLLNFKDLKGKRDFLISNSFFRGYFINSKINGKILFKDNFSFDLNLAINQIYLRKFLLYYFSQEQNKPPVISAFSKKINGKIKIYNKSSNSFIGKINDSKMLIVLENGDLRIENGSVNLGKDNNMTFNVSFEEGNADSKLLFSINFLSNDPKKFFKKFEYDFDEVQFSLVAKGSIYLKEKKIKFKNIVINNNQKISKKDVLNIEKNFNQHVISDGVLNLFDFFKIKKFIKETFVE